MDPMQPWLHGTVLIFVFSIVACGGQGEVRKTGGTYAGRGPNCEYRVIRNRIVEPYEEIGVIDIDAFSAQQLPDNEDRFRKVAGPKVCAMGGDAIIPAINMNGRWVHGSIIRFNPSECERCGAQVRSPPSIVDRPSVLERPSVDHIPVLGAVVGEGG
ncbi:MAG: hypothetical protein WCE62_07660 [Polyangiales bacterium]